MSKHPTSRRSVAQLNPTLGKHTATIPAFLNGQDTKLDQPGEFVTIEECRRLVAAGSGEFINRGKAFRRWDRDFRAHEFRHYRNRENRPRHWRAKNGAMQLVNGDAPGRTGHFSYPIPACGAHTRVLSVAAVNGTKR